MISYKRRGNFCDIVIGDKRHAFEVGLNKYVTEPHDEFAFLQDMTIKELRMYIAYSKDNAMLSLLNNRCDAQTLRERLAEYLVGKKRENNQ